jgi:hypothetical protein
MATDTTYNGWTNYETWAVKLWLDNDEGTQEYWSDRAKEILRDPRVSEYLTTDQTARYDLADELKREHEEQAPDLGATVWADLLSAAMSEVDWDEIAQVMLDDAKEFLLADGEEV